MYNNEPGAQSDPTLGYTFQNDFLALSQAFSLPEIDYTDIPNANSWRRRLKDGRSWLNLRNHIH